MNVLMNVTICVAALLVSGIATAGERVTVIDFRRAETDFYFKGRADQG
jgi:hypothetical protein